MKTVLWGDNDRDFLSQASKFLQTYFPDSEMCAVEDPQEVLAKAFERPYDVIITDFNYETGLNGIDVIRRIRQLDKSKPVYLCTNRIAGEHLRKRFNLTQPLELEAAKAEATGVLSKMDMASHPENFCKAIEKYLG